MRFFLHISSEAAVTIDTHKNVWISNAGSVTTPQSIFAFSLTIQLTLENIFHLKCFRVLYTKHGARIPSHSGVLRLLCNQYELNMCIYSQMIIMGKRQGIFIRKFVRNGISDVNKMCNLSLAISSIIMTSFWPCLANGIDCSSFLPHSSECSFRCRFCCFRGWPLIHWAYQQIFENNYKWA